MHIDAGVQEIRHNMLHHYTEKVPKINCYWVGLEALPLKHLKISH